MNCPKCNTPNMDDSLFCRACGASLAGESTVQNTSEYDMDKTMSIPMVKGDMEETVSIPVIQEKAAKPAYERHNYVAMPAPQPKKVKKGKSKEKALTFVIAFLATLIIGLCIALAVVLIGGRDKKIQNDGGTVYTDNQPSEPEVREEPAEEDKEEPEEGESIGIEEEQEGGIKIDKGFGFATGVEIESTAIEYKTLSGSDYVCDVPSVFQFVSDSGEEIRYAASDNTAYMDIGVTENKLTVKELADKVISDVGGSVRYKESGEDFFVMSIESGGVIYYQKCYAGDNIIYFEMVYPSEYDDIYSVYIADMEKSFEKK